MNQDSREFFQETKRKGEFVLVDRKTVLSCISYDYRTVHDSGTKQEA